MMIRLSASNTFKIHFDYFSQASGWDLNKILIISKLPWNPESFPDIILMKDGAQYYILNVVQDLIFG